MSDGIENGQTWEAWFSSGGPVSDGLAKKYSKQRWEPTAEDRNAARILYNELRSRITTQHLRYRDGDEIAALTSVYTLFPKTRELVEAGGAKVTQFADVTDFVLNEEIRPFTGYWHGQKTSGGLDRQDNRRLFRRALRKIKEPLKEFARIMKAMANSELHVGRPDDVSSEDDRPYFDQHPLNPSNFIGPTPSTFFKTELERIRNRRYFVYKDPEEQRFGGLGAAADGSSLGAVGLSLSGGGIRSATFCLGVVQCLAEYGVLKDVDYLSTVSGGGYLGAFLSSRLNPLNGDSGVSIEELLTKPANRTGDSEAVRHLRNNSKYLLSKSWRARFKTMSSLVQMPFRSATLHKLYRDRIASCYLVGKSAVKMSELSATGSSAPYHLVNTAVNLPGSKNEELRGRRSDFFVITPDHAGSPTTDYCVMSDLEKLDTDFTLASAMAVSGAAMSSNMGTMKISAARALATLNLSLGYWLPNPSKVKGATGKLRRGFLRLKEFWASMDENDSYVNLSDGGHIENLGLYELLRRRCKFIIAIDGECDRGRTCGALIKAQRKAAIDMGVKIDIDLRDLEIDVNNLSQCHFALGTIDYNPSDQSNSEKGILLYIKSSLTGNEPNYVKEYRTRHNSFPHETTADQFFDEDQFEAYRALGEHAADDLFGPDVVTKRELDAEETFKTGYWLNRLCREFLPPTLKPGGAHGVGYHLG